MSKHKKCQTSPEGSPRHFEEYDGENESSYNLDENIEFFDEIEKNVDNHDNHDNNDNNDNPDNHHRHDNYKKYFKHKNHEKHCPEYKCECGDQCAKLICPNRSCFSDYKPREIFNLLNTIVTPIALTQDIVAAITTIGSTVPPKTYTFDVRLPCESKIRIEVLWSPTPIIKSIWQSIGSAVGTTKTLNPFIINVVLNIHSDGSIVDNANPIPIQNNAGGSSGGFLGGHLCCSPCNLFGFTSFSIQIITQELDLISGTIFGALSLINPQGVIFRNSSLTENLSNNDDVVAPTTIGFALYPDGNIKYYLGSITSIKPTSQYSPAIYANFTHSCSCDESNLAEWTMINLTSLTL